MPNSSRSGLASVLARIAMALVVTGAVLAWLAIGNTVDASKADHRAAGVVLQQAIAVAQNADSVADQLQTSVDALSTDLADDDQFKDLAQRIAATQPALLTAIDGLQAVPDQLRAAQADLAASDDAHSSQLGLWRVAVLVGAIAALLALVAIDRLAVARR